MKRETWNLMVIIVALFILAGIAVSADTLFTLPVPGGGTFHSRWDLLTASLSLARDYLFTGGGLGAFPMLFSTYYLLVPVFFTIYSHNLFLDLLIEQGILGLGSFFWGLGIFFGIALNGLRNLTSSPTLRARLILEAALASVGVMLLHGIVDDIPYGSRALLIAFVPLAIVAALAPHLPPITFRVPSATIPALIALAALVFLWQRDAIVSAWYANLGAVEQARVELRDYAFPQRTPDVARKTMLLTQAERHFYDALQFDPENITANQRLALIALARGDYDSAQMYAQAARGVNSTDPLTMRLEANVYIAQGKSVQACEIAARAKMLGLGGPWSFALPECASQ